MKKRKAKKNTSSIEKYKIKKEINSPINDLPKALIRYLSSFFDLSSLINFSATNQKHRNLFLEMRKVYSFLNKNYFFYSPNNEMKISKNQIFQILFNKKYEILKDYKDDSPLHYAAIFSSLGMLKYFLENKIEVNSKGGKLNSTPLHYVCYPGSFSLKMVKHLVENKADVNMKDKNNELAFILPLKIKM